MEILSNLAWGLVVVALWGIWLAGLGRRNQTQCRDKASLLPAIGIQLIALAMLSAVLLPAISVTDDLHSANFPAEVERTLSRNDRHLVPGQSMHPLPVALALLLLTFRPPQLHTIAFLSGDALLQRPSPAYPRALWSRPPPAA